MATWSATFTADERLMAFANYLYGLGRFDRAAAAYNLLVKTYGRNSRFGADAAWRHCESLAPMRLDIEEWAADVQGPIWIYRWQSVGAPPSDRIDAAIAAYRDESLQRPDKAQCAEALRRIALLDRHLDRIPESDAALRSAEAIGQGLKAGADALWNLADGLEAQGRNADAATAYHRFASHYASDPRAKTAAEFAAELTRLKK